MSEQKRDIQLLKAYMRAIRSANPNLQNLEETIEYNEILDMLLAVYKIFFYKRRLINEFPCLTDEEVELAIQHAGVSIEEPHSLSPSGQQHLLHPPHLAPVQYSLTDEEVELAIQHAGVSIEEPHSLSPSGQQHLLHPPHLAPVQYSPSGSRWRDYGALAIIMAGMAFGFQQLYRKYILPLIMGSREDKKHLQRIESNISEMSGTLTQTVTQLQTTLASVQERLVQQQQRIQELSQELATSEVESENSGDARISGDPLINSFSGKTKPAGVRSGTKGTPFLGELDN
ncbi:UNVERIFIED_CONTAM: hypothetical protein FKN15_011112 [Acipenser sinensis]